MCHQLKEVREFRIHQGLSTQMGEWMYRSSEAELQGSLLETDKEIVKARMLAATRF
jgi:hypothetical protein